MSDDHDLGDPYEMGPRPNERCKCCGRWLPPSMEEFTMRQGDKVILRSDEALHALEHGLHRLEEAAVDWFCAEKAPEDSDEPTQEELEAMDELSNAACFVGVCSLYLDHLDEHPEDDVKVKS